MKYTLCITQQCNLRCSYCYIQKKKAVMSLETAESIINNIFDHTPSEERIDIGFFGGEPLLEFPHMKRIVDLIESHPSFEVARVCLDVVTNGTIFSDEIGEYLADHNITFCLSCDGPPQVQDKSRRYRNGLKSSPVVERTLREAARFFPAVLVNAVYRPDTFEFLPQVVDYFSSLGIRQIYLNPDYSASWSKEDADKLFAVFSRLADQYVDFYRKNNPHYISVIDSKILVMLKEGYSFTERCRMGRGEFAFAPSGNIYPCERLIGADEGSLHCIGHIASGLSNVRPCVHISRSTHTTRECSTCSLADYCMNWCGCSNFFSTGSYERMGPFQCASEKAAISAAFQAFNSLERELGAAYIARLMKFSSADVCKGRVA